MDFLPPDIVEYTEAYTSPEPLVLKELNRETQAQVIMPRMLSGHLQGRVLSMFSHMIKPAQILEIGTYTGYSAICMAEGLILGGMLHTIDINEELIDRVHEYIEKSGFTDRIRTYVGDATQVIPGISQTFDLVFIDADKENYCRYYDLVFPKVRPGGFIIADNVLWSGHVLKPEKEMDDETRALSEFNMKVRADARIEHVLFPLRDGLMVIRKPI